MIETVTVRALKPAYLKVYPEGNVRIIDKGDIVELDRKSVFQDGKISDSFTEDLQRPTDMPNAFNYVRKMAERRRAGLGMPTPGDPGRDAVIRKEVMDLDHSDPSQWNKDGSVSLEYLSRQVGQTVTRKELEKLAPGVVRK